MGTGGGQVVGEYLWALKSEIEFCRRERERERERDSEEVFRKLTGGD